MTFLAALKKKNEGPIPVWLMRQAGRFLPSYHLFKRHHTLKELFHDPSMVTAITQLPLEVLELDAAILFSDILTVLEGLGVDYRFEEGIGPLIDFDKIVRTKNCYQHIKEAITRLKGELSVPLIGFAGAPFTIASYLVEGRTSKQFLKAKQILFSNPDYFEELLAHVVDETIAYLDLQIDAGVDAIQLFDSWANHLARPQFLKYSLAPLEKIVSHVKSRGIPVIVFSKASSLYPHELAAIEPTALSLDWACDLPALRSTLPAEIVLQGNLDPSVLFGAQETIQQALDAILTPMKDDHGYIFNLGHGVLPTTPFENVKFMVDYVHSFTRSPLQTP